MKRIVLLSISTMIILFSFTGCAPELHERLLIRCIGVDYTDSAWQVTVRAVDPGAMEKEISFTEEGETVASALEQIARSTGKKPLYSHNALLVFGRTCAERGLKDCLDFFLRHYDSRPTVKVALAEQTAEEILRIDPSEQNPVLSEDIAALLKAEEYSSTTVDADLITLINGTYGANQSAVLPILRGGDTIEISSAGLLANMKLCAELDDASLRGYLLLSGKLNTGETVFQNDACGQVTVSANSSRCSIRFTGTEESPRFMVEAEIKGEISSITGETMKIDGDVFPKLELQYAAAILQNVEAYLNSAVFSSGKDAAGFGRAVQKENPACLRMSSESYSDFLKRAEIDIRITTHIERVEEEDTPYL